MFVRLFGLSFYLVYNLNYVSPLDCKIDHSIHGPIIEQAFAFLDDGPRISILISQVLSAEVQQ